MNLSNLFQIQSKLDKRIVKEHGLEGQDLLDKKILALQVELGECANEYRAWKFWSEDRKPRITSDCSNCDGVGGWHNDAGFHPCEVCWGVGESGNPLLEEYVDCLHFILSIGLDLELEDRHNSLIYEIEEDPEDLVLMFPEVMSHTCDLFWNCYHEEEYEVQEFYYKATFSNFLKLGELLGFTWEQIEQAYLGKNKINHERQNTGY